MPQSQFRNIAEVERMILTKGAPGATWTREEVEALIRFKPWALERAIVRLYKHQTGDEQREGATKHSNGIGFNASHADEGTYIAKWIINGNLNDPRRWRRVSGGFIRKAQRIALFYAGQLTKVANGLL